MMILGRPGESAGGAAVYTNLDYIAGRFPQAATAGAAIAGFNNWCGMNAIID